MPKKIVPIAPQRNQNRAAGVMNLPSAGRSSSGIFGVVGVATKLKYQSRPIHITPEMMCSQRTKNSQKALSACMPTCRPVNAEDDQPRARSPRSPHRGDWIETQPSGLPQICESDSGVYPTFPRNQPLSLERELLRPDRLEPGDHDQPGHHHRREERGDDAEAQRHGEAAHRAVPSWNRISEAIRWVMLASMMVAMARRKPWSIEAIMLRPLRCSSRMRS